MQKWNVWDIEWNASISTIQSWPQLGHLMQKGEVRGLKIDLKIEKSE